MKTMFMVTSSLMLISEASFRTKKNCLFSFWYSDIKIMAHLAQCNVGIFINIFMESTAIFSFFSNMIRKRMLKA